ncbi:MAG: Rpp14/Pop5 family protein [Candidatus Bathyarchaeia archaeon]
MLKVIYRNNIELTKEKLQSMLLNSILTLFGEIGLVESKFKLVIFNQEKNLAIVKCAKNFLNNFRAATALINNLNGVEASIFIVKVSGTIKGVKKFLPFNKVKHN